MFSYLTLVQIMQTIRMVLDIVIVWILLYYVIKMVRGNNKTTQIFKGIIFLMMVQAIAKYFGLETLAYLTDNVMTWGFLALIIIFQPEIRSILERVGTSNVFTRMATLSGSEKEKLVNALMDATSNLAESKTGALITLEQSASLSDFIKTGVQMNSIVTAELLCSIFTKTTPLHDGAVIIQGDRISCGSAYFPPTTLDLPSRYGARHRAAIGISEITDAITIVVSEETGKVAVAEEGKLIQMNERKLRSYLNRVILGRDIVTAESVAPTSAESVSIDSLFEKEVEDLETGYNEITTNTGSVVVIEEEGDDDIPFSSSNSDMKTFRQSDFKDDTTNSIPIVSAKTDKISTVDVHEKQTSGKPGQAKNENDTKEKGGLFNFLRKDKQTKKSDVEQIVKEVAKEMYTTQQLKLQDIKDADEKANENEKNKTQSTAGKNEGTTPQVAKPQNSAPKPVAGQAQVAQNRSSAPTTNQQVPQQPPSAQPVANKPVQTRQNTGQAVNSNAQMAQNTGSTPVVSRQQALQQTGSIPVQQQPTGQPGNNKPTRSANSRDQEVPSRQNVVSSYTNSQNVTPQRQRTANSSVQTPVEADIEVPNFGTRKPKGGE